MSYHKQITIHCDECGEWADFGRMFSTETGARGIWVTAKRVGWTKVGNRLHFCPSCSVEEKPRE